MFNIYSDEGGPGYVKFIGGGNRLFHTTLFMYFVIVILKTILWQKFSLNIFTMAGIIYWSSSLVQALSFRSSFIEEKEEDTSVLDSSEEWIESSESSE